MTGWCYAGITPPDHASSTISDISMSRHLTRARLCASLHIEVRDIATNCQHGKVSCKLCGGPTICHHRQHRQRCVVCSPVSARRKYELDANRFHREFRLTLNDFILIVSQPCFYCGESQEQRGIDRWDNSKGYILTNCLSCCSICNMMKKSMTMDKFIMKVKQIAERHKYR